MKTYKTLVSFAIYLCLALMLFAFIFVCFFISNLDSTMKLQNEINKAHTVIDLLNSTHRTRAMSSLYFIDQNADKNILKVLEENNLKLAKDANISYDFIREIERLNLSFETNLSPKLMIEEIDSLDKYFFNYFENTLSLNTNPKINGEMVALNTVVRDIIFLNKVRDFVIRFASNDKKLGAEEIRILDEIRFKFLNYALVAKSNTNKVKFLFYTTDELSKNIDEIIAIQNENKDNITSFYDTLREVMISGNLISPLRLIELSKRIETLNSNIAHLLIGYIQKDIYTSTRDLIIYTTVACFVFLFCFVVFFIVLLKRRAMVKDINDGFIHIEHIKQITKKRGIKITSKEALKLVAQSAEYIYKSDTINESYKSEYSHFMENINHGIINPLNDIIGYTELLMIQKLSQNEQQNYIKEINSSTLVLVKLFENLIKIAGIQSNNLKLNLVEISPFDGLSGILSDISQKAQKENIDLDVFIDPDLEGVVVCDTEKIRFMLTVLLENALKHNRKNGKILFIVKRIHSGRNDTIIQITIVDKGYGIKRFEARQEFGDKDDEKLRIFSQKGLDLAIVNEYAKLMQSQGLKIKTKENVGTKISLSIKLEFKEKNELKNKFKGEKIYIYDENIDKQSDMPKLNLETLPSYYDILCSYFDYLGLEYELTTESGKDLYFIRGNEEPFDMKKCIFASNEKPLFTNEDKVWISDVFSVDMLASAYEIVTGKLKSTDMNFKLDAQALVLASPAITTEISHHIAHIHTTLNNDIKYDIAFIDLDKHLNIAKQIHRGTQLVAISKEYNLTNIGKGVYSNYIIKPEGEELSLSVVKSISLALSELRRKKMLADKYLRDILLFKNSVAANNIYKSAIIGFAPRIDVANNLEEFENLLDKNTYKIALVDFNVPGLSVDRYLELINKARTKRKFSTIAGLFISPESKLMSKEFEIFYTNVSKARLETRLRQLLNSMYDF